MSPQTVTGHRTWCTFDSLLKISLAYTPIEVRGQQKDSQTFLLYLVAEHLDLIFGDGFEVLKLFHLLVQDRDVLEG